jgi:hypothetical protein
MSNAVMLITSYVAGCVLGAVLWAVLHVWLGVL